MCDCYPFTPYGYEEIDNGGTDGLTDRMTERDGNRDKREILKLAISLLTTSNANSQSHVFALRHD